MNQLICLALLTVVAFAMNGALAAQMASDGNWGGAIGRVLVGPLVMFFLCHSVVYFASILVSGRAKVRGFALSRANYIALAVALTGVIGMATVPPAS